MWLSPVMLHLMSTSTQLQCLTEIEDASQGIFPSNHIIRVFREMIKFKPLVVDFNLLKDAKDIPLRMETLPFKILILIVKLRN